MKNISWKSKLVAGLLAFLPLYFSAAALGTKFGFWSWQTGLGTLTVGGGPIVLGAVAIISLVLLIMALIKKPRTGWVLPAIGVLVPLGILAALLSLGATAAEHPIHDVATDTANPPEFSAETMAAREAFGANPLHDYQTPLRDLEMFKPYSEEEPEMGIKSHAQIITDTYADLSPLPLGGASKEDAVAAVAAAMGKMGFDDIRTDVEAGRVEGVAETFWFGFKDDVVARVGENEIDFRSVSRVGRSDLGANAKRIEELRELTASQIGQR
ncbi:DUF1499 domain-containing protein [Erythrobacter sp. THAF29]|uniref:DUF1499 domain-containing protein n=1 Tax=Erythrobacter sp. THAF29 TaxID=2587851 RepID=UPI001268FC9D|nr:DUF1499 domain-containing protein [Erythrobacter sp. THAF29]QFT78653.1 hypothetical protein FIU90_13975 [Erythrobacter sp. THAF29]